MRRLNRQEFFMLILIILNVIVSLPLLIYLCKYVKSRLRNTKNYSNELGDTVFSAVLIGFHPVIFINGLSLVVDGLFCNDQPSNFNSCSNAFYYPNFALSITLILLILVCTFFTFLLLADKNPFRKNSKNINLSLVLIGIFHKVILVASVKYQKNITLLIIFNMVSLFCSLFYSFKNLNFMTYSGKLLEALEILNTTFLLNLSPYFVIQFWFGEGKESAVLILTNMALALIETMLFITYKYKFYNIPFFAALNHTNQGKAFKSLASYASVIKSGHYQMKFYFFNQLYHFMKSQGCELPSNISIKQPQSDVFGHQLDKRELKRHLNKSLTIILELYLDYMIRNNQLFSSTKLKKFIYFHVYLMFYKTNLKNKAMLTLFSVVFKNNKNNQDVFDKFEEFKLLIMLERHCNTQFKSSATVVKFDIQSLLNFNKNFVKFKKNIMKTAQIVETFWKELKEYRPKVKFLLETFDDISKNYARNNKAFNEIIKNKICSKVVFSIYKKYLQSIFFDWPEIAKMQKVVDCFSFDPHTSLKTVDLEAFRIKDESPKMFFCISGDGDRFGYIDIACESVRNFLNQEVKSLTGRHIETIKPSFMKGVYEGCIEGCLTNANEKLHESKFFTDFWIDSEGYLKSSLTTIKMIPKIRDGIELFIMSVLVQIDSSKVEGVIAVDLRSRSLMNVSKGLDSNFHISPKMIHEDQLSGSTMMQIDNIFPNLLSASVLENLKKGAPQKIQFTQKNLKELIISFQTELHITSPSKSKVASEFGRSVTHKNMQSFSDSSGSINLLDSYTFLDKQYVDVEWINSYTFKNQEIILFSVSSHNSKNELMNSKIREMNTYNQIGYGNKTELEINKYQNTTYHLEIMKRKNQQALRIVKIIGLLSFVFFFMKIGIAICAMVGITNVVLHSNNLIFGSSSLTQKNMHMARGIKALQYVMAKDYFESQDIYNQTVEEMSFEKIKKRNELLNLNEHDYVKMLLNTTQYFIDLNFKKSSATDIETVINDEFNFRKPLTVTFPSSLTVGLTYYDFTYYFMRGIDEIKTSRKFSDYIYFTSSFATYFLLFQKWWNSYSAFFEKVCEDTTNIFINLLLSNFGMAIIHYIVILIAFIFALRKIKRFFLIFSFIRMDELKNFIEKIETFRSNFSEENPQKALLLNKAIDNLMIPAFVEKIKENQTWKLNNNNEKYDMANAEETVLKDETAREVDEDDDMTNRKLISNKQKIDRERCDYFKKHLIVEFWLIFSRISFLFLFSLLIILANILIGKIYTSKIMVIVKNYNVLNSIQGNCNVLSYYAVAATQGPCPLCPESVEMSISSLNQNLQFYKQNLDSFDNGDLNSYYKIGIKMSKNVCASKDIADSGNSDLINFCKSRSSMQSSLETVIINAIDWYTSFTTAAVDPSYIQAVEDLIDISINSLTIEMKKLSSTYIPRSKNILIGLQLFSFLVFLVLNLIFIKILSSQVSEQHFKKSRAFNILNSEILSTNVEVIDRIKEDYNYFNN